MRWPCGKEAGWSREVRRAHRRPRREHATRQAVLGERGHRLHRAGQDRVLQPGRVREGPHRPPDDRGRRGVRRAQARRHHRGAHLRQHRRGARPGRAEARLRPRLRLPRQGEPGQAGRAAGIRGPGGGLPDRRPAGAPRLVLLRVRPPGARDRRRLEAEPVRQPDGTRRATTRPPDRRSGPTPRGGSPTSSPASAPAGRSAVPAGTSRRSPRDGSGSSARTPRARSTQAAAVARTSSRGSARTSGPRRTTRRSSTRSSRSPTPTRSR